MIPFILVLMILPLVLLGLALALGTRARDKWGINLKPVHCPACRSPMPQIRRPKSLRQALWGGGTCERCGCQLDKWGRRIGQSP